MTCDTVKFGTVAEVFLLSLQDFKQQIKKTKTQLKLQIETTEFHILSKCLNNNNWTTKVLPSKNIIKILKIELRYNQKSSLLQLKRYYCYCNFRGVVITP